MGFLWYDLEDRLLALAVLMPRAGFYCATDICGTGYIDLSSIVSSRYSRMQMGALVIMSLTFTHDAVPFIYYEP